MNLIHFARAPIADDLIVNAAFTRIYWFIYLKIVRQQFEHTDISQIFKIIGTDDQQMYALHETRNAQCVVRNGRLHETLQRHLLQVVVIFGIRTHQFVLRSNAIHQIGQFVQRQFKFCACGHERCYRFNGPGCYTQRLWCEGRMTKN